MSGGAGERALRHVAALASGPPVDPGLRIHLQFHPDRLCQGRLDPRIIGDAARTGRFDAQNLKRVWHHVARFG